MLAFKDDKSIMERRRDWPGKNDHNSIRQHRRKVASSSSGEEEEEALVGRGSEESDLDLQTTVFQSRWKELEKQESKMMSQKTFIRQERRRLLLQKALLNAEKQRFTASVEPDWFCSEAFPPSQERRIVLEVGSKIFEISATLASKDQGSLLAALANKDSPLADEEQGCFRVDRDWWVFRNILNFLRDGMLPSNTKTLKLMYQESEFWKFESIKRAIEERHVTCSRRSDEEHSKVEQSMHSLSIEQRDSKLKYPWWAHPPKWWGHKLNDEKEKQTSSEKKTSSQKKSEWWTGSVYNGVDFSKTVSSSRVRNRQKR